MIPFKIFDLQIGQSALFGPEYGDLATMTLHAGRIAQVRARRHAVEAAPGGTLVTRLTDKDEKAPKVPKARPERPDKPPTLAQRLLAIAPGTSEFILARERNPESLRTTASHINKRGERRLRVVVETSPLYGTRVTSLDLSEPVTDATGTAIDFAAGQRMRKYPFSTMGPGDSFTVPAGKTTIAALRGSVQYYRTRVVTLQYRITTNPDGSFTVKCSSRTGGF